MQWIKDCWLWLVSLFQPRMSREEELQNLIGVTHMQYKPFLSVGLPPVVQTIPLDKRTLTLKGTLKDETLDIALDASSVQDIPVALEAEVTFELRDVSFTGKISQPLVLVVKVADLMEPPAPAGSLVATLSRVESVEDPVPEPVVVPEPVPEPVVVPEPVAEVVPPVA